MGNKIETASELIELIGGIIMEGDISCSEKDEIYGYELVLKEASMITSGIEGSFKVLLSKVPVSVSVTFDFE